MLRRLFLTFVLICLMHCKCSSYSVENLYTVLDQTSDYVKNYSNGYDISNIINNIITKYVENTTKPILQRQKRSQNYLENNKEINVLQGFEETVSVNLPDFQDIAFISIQDEQRLLLFAAAINFSNMQLYQLVNNKAQLLGTYSQPNGKRIIVHNYNNGILIVIQRNTDEIVILRFAKNKNGMYELHFKQEFEIPKVLHMNMWYGMNQLYLGIASDTKVFIYVWLGEHFDKINTFHFGARKLLPFQSKSFMHIVAAGPITRLFRFSVRSNKFIEMQKFHDTQDISSFFFKEGHFEERFLILANDNSTILYKEMYDRFVPFQKISPAKYIHSLTMGGTVVLLLAEEEDIVGIYQYNGWRFLKLHTKLSNIHQIHQIGSYDENMLLMQNQNREWKFFKPIWIKQKTWQSSQNEINAWCSEIKQKASQRTLKKIPGLKNPVKIPKAHIGQLRVQNINDHNATELIRLTQQYKRVVAKLSLANSTLAEGISAEKSKYTVLYGKKITVKCKRQCHIRHIKTDSEIKPMAAKSKELTLDQINTDQTLEFASLKVKAINNWKCPIPNVAIDDIFVKKSVNGISMKTLQEGTLKISGDQEISGEHIFANLYATNVSIPLNIATCNTTQTVLIKEARVKELYLTEDEFFLPLNGSVTTMSGSITAPKVKVTGLVHLKGTITGKGRELSLLKEIFAPLELSRDCFLQNVTFRNLVKAKDIVRPHGLSLKGILENTVPLNSDVPEHLILFSDKIQWNNVTLWNYKNWVTKNSTDTIIISGAKFASNNVILTTATYAKLPIPKLTVPLCAMEVIIQEVRTSLITIDDLFVKDLYVSHVFGANNLNNIFDSASALQSIDFSTKLFTGQILVKNISVSEIKGIDIKDLKIQTNKLVDVNYLKGPIEISNLVVNKLEIPAIFNLSLPIKVKNVIMKADSNIEKINDLNISSFMESVLKVDDIISLEHVVFAHGFSSNQIHAPHSTLNLSHKHIHPNLYSKRISTTLITTTINIPQTFGYVASDVPSTFFIQGTAKFVKEPYVRNMKDINLKKLSENLWMSNQDTIVSGNNMNITHMAIEGNVIIYDSKNSLYTKMWLDLSTRLLSKTKQQNITVASSFKNVEAPTVIAANDTILQTSDSNLMDLLTNSLMKNMTQIVDAVWHFEELNIGNLNWKGKLNDIDLNKDIVRYDVKQNIITGKKTIVNLTTRDLWSYNKQFSNWASNALTKRCQKFSKIKGQKTFKNISLNNLSVKGTIMGRKIEEALLKSESQTIFGIKKIKGHLNTPSIITDYHVNDADLARLTNNQVKKYQALQIIETKIDFRNDLEIFGNVTISGLYDGTDLIDISDHNRLDNKLDAVLSKTTKIMELTEDIRTVLYNSEIYVSKFEAVDENMLEITADPDTENVLNSTCLCEPKNIPLLCNDTRLWSILADVNSSSIIRVNLLLLDDTVFIVIISSDFVSIYTYNAEEQKIDEKASFYVPNILQASVESADMSLWIVLNLPKQTLVLRYQVWNEIEQYILPASNALVTHTMPNNQRLLIRSDGIWDLAGVFYPRHSFKMPLNGEIKTFALGDDYYVKVTAENSTTVLKARYIGD